MEQDMSKAGSRVGPGPATRNIAQINKVTLRSKGNLSKSPRKLGDVLLTKDNPSSAHYYLKDS